MMIDQKFRQLGLNVLWLIGDRLFRMILGLAVLGAYARYFSTEEFGYLRYAISVTSIFTAVAGMGIEGIVIREIVKAPSHASLILGSAWLLRLIGGCAAIGVTWIALAVTHETKAVTSLSIIISIGFLPQSFEVIDLWFQKQIQSKFTVLAKNTAAVLGAGFKISLIWLQAPLAWFAAAIVLDAVFIAIGLLWIYQCRGEKISNWRPSWALARGLVRDSWPLIISGLLISIYTRIEQVLVMRVLGSHAMGIYQASVSIAEMWIFIPGFILSTIYPLLVEQRLNDRTNYRIQLQKVFDLITGLGYGVAVLATGLSSWIIPMIFGPNYAGAEKILMIQAWTAPIVFSGSVRAQYFLLENVTIYHTASAILGIVANVTLCLWWMPRLGAAGAALAALAGYWVAGYGASFLFGPLRECAYFQTKAFFLPLRWIMQKLA